MHSRLAVFGGLAAASFLLAACGAGGSYATGPGGQPTVAPVGSSPSPAASPTIAPVATPKATPTPAPRPSGTTIGTGNTRLGSILVDAKGRTVYLFVADFGTSSRCNSAQCVQYWPPVLTTGSPQAGAGANAALLGTTKRADGTTEVTYAGHPLYYFISDKRAGDLTGQGIDGFGGPWYVVSPSGKAIV
jgi:predicted lipoprotein with Yx(FWY)xxD motif